ncbi:membrane-associated tyrosine- and threonine-specific cdc2-inhibitory kinase-like [Uranotaenia lowii]|uniref:membrane-associated tyrosine- and threonine-specific cdc2-inhibitory kinase-like n=1 Tax=Uranotaenia lowii TaxID=190385 RepID=UPI00247945B4|nr:membrane-associated tyrosine- and threonine-specific cdc2-inhibitory kinase-like [Uranotaenia lowii]
MKSSLPVPEFLEENNLSLSFKQPNRRNQSRPPKAPKLYPKFDASFCRNGTGSTAASVVSFRVDQRAELSQIYQRHRPESYYEQCFEQLTKVGEGSFGEVFKVKSRLDGCLYAVKKSKEFFRGEHYRQERLEEVRRYEQFSEHENCVKLYQAWEQEDRLFMQMELCKGSLEDYAREQRIITEENVWSILLDLLLALKSLHDRNLIHLDIKLDNILITDEGVCKLADFGLVFDLNNRNLHHATEGDSRYIAPELMEGRYTKAVDIFSLGIAILELSCNLELPSNGPLWQRLRSGLFPPELLCRLSSDLQNVIRWMMSPKAESRPTVDTLLQHHRIAALHQERKRWRVVRGIRSYLHRKLCNLRCFLASLVLSIASCLRLRHAKPAVVAVEGRKRKRDSQIPSYNHSFNSAARTCLMKDFDNDSDVGDDEDELMSSGELDLTGGSAGSNVQITPTLNNTVPIHTPTVRMMNSTPLNHNHSGLRLSFRNQNIDTPFRSMSFDSGEDECLMTMDVSNNGSVRSESSLNQQHQNNSGYHHQSHSRHSSLHQNNSGGGLIGFSGNANGANDSSFLTKKKLFFQSDDSD